MTARISHFLLLCFCCWTPLSFAAIQDTAFVHNDLSPWGMFQAADWIVKAVLIALLISSVLTWAIWLFKTVHLHVARRDSRSLLAWVIHAENFAMANKNLDQQKGNSLLLLKACRHEIQLSSMGLASDEGLKERILARLERVQISLVATMNQGTGILASIGSVAPFVGLFGTVWGIMNSFIGIAETQTTNLAVVAPGIAEALLATAVGLLAAIPAVLTYNHFARSIARYRVLIMDIMTALMILISRDLDRHHKDAGELPNLLLDKNSSSISLVKDAV